MCEARDLNTSWVSVGLTPLFLYIIIPHMQLLQVNCATMRVAIDMRTPGGDRWEADLPKSTVKQEIGPVVVAQWPSQPIYSICKISARNYMQLLQGNCATMSAAINMKQLAHGDQDPGLSRSCVKQEIWAVPGCQWAIYRIFCIWRNLTCICYKWIVQRWEWLSPWNHLEVIARKQTYPKVPWSKRLGQPLLRSGPCSKISAPEGTKVIRHLHLLQVNCATLSSPIDMRPPRGHSQEAGLPKSTVKQGIGPAVVALDP